MPYYSFRNKETGEEFELSMKMDEREPFLAENPHLEQILTSIRVGDSVHLNTRKYRDSTFSKYVLAPMAERNPGSNIGKGKFPLIKEW